MMGQGVQCNQDQMGKMYGALGQRRAQIQREDLWEGTPIFHIEAYLARFMSIAKQASTGGRRCSMQRRAGWDTRWRRATRRIWGK